MSGKVGSCGGIEELRAVWHDTRLVVYTAISAALYAAILIPFKVLPLIPGVTEFRPANAVPVVCSFLFGPAAAWGSAIGNLIGDLFAGIGPGDAFGFLGNFLYGLIPYRAWRALTDRDPVPTTLADWARFVVVVVLAGGACAFVIAWGLNWLGFVPFPLLANVILWNNVVVAVVLAPWLLRILYPRVKAGGLLYSGLRRDPGPARRRALGLLVLGGAATIAGHGAGTAIFAGHWRPPWVVWMAGESANRAPEVGLGLLPLVVAVFACFLAL